ncbi:MAG: cation:proton antiporter [Oligoflexia bacterium]|nr:cation:proton antiporter [Oligoflexia bacterium]
MKKLAIVLILILTQYFISKYFVDFGANLLAATLVAMGMILLVAFSLAELGLSLGLPMVTGFLLTGIFLGPEVGQFLTTDIVSKLKMFNTFAIGMIALTAGLEFDLKTLARDYKSLGSTIFFKIIFLALFITPLFYFIEMKFHFLGLPANDVLKVGFLFAALGIGTSPAISLAVIAETNAKGRIANLVLNNAILKDFVIVIILTILMSVLAALSGKTEFSLVLIYNQLFYEIGHSLLFGTIIGVAIILYLRFINFEIFLFLVALLIVVAELSNIFHLELLLVFITAGAVVKNCSKLEHKLHGLLTKISIPIFVIFFTNAGAAINLESVRQTFLLAFLLFSARILAYYCASKWSSSLTKEKRVVTNNVWMGYISQAGVTLGLIEIISIKFPEWATPLRTVGMGVVSLNLLIGPILLKIALKRGKENHDIEAESVLENKPKSMKVMATTRKVSPAGLQLLPLSLPRPQAKAELHWTCLEQKIKQVNSYPLEVVLRLFYGKIQTFFTLEIKEQSERFRELRNQIWNLNKELFSLQDKKQQLTWMNNNIQNYWFHYEIYISFIKNLLKEQLSLQINSIPEKITIEMTGAQLLQLSLTQSIPLGKFKSLKYSFGKNKIFRIDFPVQAQLKTYIYPVLLEAISQTLDYYQKYHYNLFITMINEESTPHFFSKDNFIDLNHLAEQKILHFLSKEMDLFSLSAHTLLVQGNVICTLSQIAKKTALILKEIEDSSFQWAKVNSALKDLICNLNNLFYAKKTISLKLQEKLFIPLETLLTSIRKRSSVLLQQLNKIKEGENPLTEIIKVLESPECIEYHRDSMQLDPYEIEHHLHACFREIETHFSKTTLSFSLGFDNNETNETTEKKDASINSELLPRVRTFDFKTTYKQSILLEFLPTIKKHLENIYKEVDLLWFYHQEVLGQTLDVFKKTQQTNENMITYFDAKNIQSIYNDYSNKVLHIEQTTLGSTKEIFTSLDLFSDQLKIRFLIFDIKTSTAVGLDFVWNKIVFNYKKFLSFMKKIFIRFTGTVSEEFKKYLNPDLVIFKSQRRRVITSLIKEVSGKFFSIRVLYDSKEISGFYEECFSLEPIKSEHFFSVNNDTYKQICQFEEQWKKNGKNAYLVIVGSAGSGKTSLLNMLKLGLGTENIFQMNDDYLSKRTGSGLPMTLSQLSQLPRSSLKVVLCDDLDQLPMKNEKGSLEFKEFIRRIMSESSNTLWIFTCQAINLSYLNSAFDFDLVVHRTYFLTPMTSEQAIEVILKRQQHSGRKIVFNKIFWQKALSDDFLIKAYIRALNKQSQGNLRLLIHYWVCHVKEDKNQQQTFVEGWPGFFSIEASFIMDLPDCVYLVLRYLVCFGESSIDEVARTTKLERNDIEKALNYLRSMHLIQESFLGKRRFSIYPVFHSEIYKFFEGPFLLTENRP